MVKYALGFVAFGALALASPAFAQAAPALTSVNITLVKDSVTTEITKTETSTVNHFASPPVYVQVDEIGVGGSKITKLGGQQMSFSGTTVSLCGSTSNPQPCTAGQTAIGQRTTYNLASQAPSGRVFFFQDTSANAPKNTYSDSLTIN